MGCTDPVRRTASTSCCMPATSYAPSLPCHTVQPRSQHFHPPDQFGSLNRSKMTARSLRNVSATDVQNLGESAASGIGCDQFANVLRVPFQCSSSTAYM